MTVKDGTAPSIQTDRPATSPPDWQQSPEMFRLFVDEVQDYAILMLDPEGRVMSWNDGAERIKGYKATDIVGHDFSIFYTQEDRRAGKPQRLLALAAQTGHAEEEGWRVRKNGSWFWANVSITTIRNGDGRLIGFGKVTRDLTERMRVQQSLQESQRSLEASERSLRALSLHVLRTQDDERKRIGREIHDSLGQYLSVLKMKLDSMGSAPGLEKECAECVKLVEHCVREVRTISYLLYPPMLEEMGLNSAIPWYLEGFSSRSGIKTTLQIPIGFPRLSREAELVLFRVLQECLTNVQRHSGSQTADIAISCRENRVTLEVADHGTGMSQALFEQGGADWISLLGVGMRSMTERVRELGGRLEIDSGDRGTTVRATVPLEVLQPSGDGSA